MLGLIDAVVENFPEAHHAHCLRHLHENFKKVVKNAEIAALVYKAASRPTRKEMADVLASMPAEGAQWLMRNQPEHWADSYFAGLRFGHRTSNIAESFNSWMLEARGQPVLAMMERIREQMMLTRAKRLKEIQKLKDEGKKISNFAARELAKSALLAREYNVVQANVDEYEVRSRQNECFPVRLDIWTCVCGRWRNTLCACRRSDQLFEIGHDRFCRSSLQGRSIRSDLSVRHSCHAHSQFE
ncbi:hypothetical protein V1509DRAFT_512339 [Lipomyces kononenkoae]